MGQAFALRSPVEVFAQDSAVSGSPVFGDFGVPMVVAEDAEAGLVGVCLGPEIGWIRQEDLMVVAQARLAMVTPSAAGVSRPKIGFWTDIARLRRFLVGDGPFEFDADLTDVPMTGPPDTAVHLPVLEQSDAASLSGDVPVVRLLLPVDAAAAGQLRDQAPGAGIKLPVLVLDLSGNAVDFTVDLFEAVRPELQRIGSFEMILLTAGDMATPPRLITMTAAFDPRDHAPGTLSLAEALSLVTEQASRQVILLLAGDQPVPDVALLRQSTLVLAAQVTPELDPEFLQSLQGRPATVLPFDQALKAHAPNALAKIASPLAARAERQAIFEQFATAQAGAGFLPVLPVDEDRAEMLTDVPSGAVWFARPVWTVLNEQVLQIDAAQ